MQYPEVPNSSKENKKSPVKSAICGILMNEKGEIFLAKRTAKRTFNPACFDLLGGDILEGETPRDTLIRDTKEKIGIELEKDKVQGKEVKDIVYPNDTWRTFIFVCNIKSQTQIALNPKKYSEWGWFTFEQVKQLKLSPKVLEVLTKMNF